MGPPILIFYIELGKERGEKWRHGNVRWLCQGHMAHQWQSWHRTQERLFSTPVLKHPDHPASSKTTLPLWNVWKFTGIFPDFYRDFFVVVVVPHLAYSCLPKSSCWGVSISLKLHKQTVGQKNISASQLWWGILFSRGGLERRNPSRGTAPTPCPPRLGLTATQQAPLLAPSLCMRCTMEPGVSPGLPNNAIAFCHCPHCFPLELRNKTQTFQSPDSSSSRQMLFAVFQQHLNASHWTHGSSLLTNPPGHIRCIGRTWKRHPDLTPSTGDITSKVHGEDVTIFNSSRKKNKHSISLQPNHILQLATGGLHSKQKVKQTNPKQCLKLARCKNAFRQWHFSFTSCRFIFLSSDCKNNKKKSRGEKGKSKHSALTTGWEMDWKAVCVHVSLWQSWLVCVRSQKPVLTSAEVWPAIPLPCWFVHFLLSHFISH